MRIVGPSIVRPWLERIDACASPTEARALLDELCALTELNRAIVTGERDYRPFTA